MIKLWTSAFVIAVMVATSPCVSLAEENDSASGLTVPPAEKKSSSIGSAEYSYTWFASDRGKYKFSSNEQGDIIIGNGFVGEIGLLDRDAIDSISRKLKEIQQQDQDNENWYYYFTIGIMLIAVSCSALAHYMLKKGQSGQTRRNPTGDRRFPKLVVSMLGLILRQKDVDEWSGDLLEGYDNELEHHSLWYCRIWLLKEVAWLAWPLMKPFLRKAMPWLFGGGAVWAFVKSLYPESRNDDK